MKQERALRLANRLMAKARSCRELGQDAEADSCEAKARQLARDHGLTRVRDRHPAPIAMGELSRAMRTAAAAAQNITVTWRAAGFNPTQIIVDDPFAPTTGTAGAHDDTTS